MNHAALLSPAQAQAFDKLMDHARHNAMTVLASGAGRGRTTVLRAASAQLGGLFLDARAQVDALVDQNPHAIEETIYRLFYGALHANEFVVVDDFQLLASLLLGRNGMYMRPGLLMLPLAALSAIAEQRSHHLILGGDPATYVGDRRGWIAIGDFTAADYQVIASAHLPQDVASRIDFERIHGFAPRLTAAQLSNVAQWLSRAENADTDAFMERLQVSVLTSNVDLGEVQPVQLHDLKGLDDVLQALEAHVLVPIERPDLAEELNLRPKRGILLAGPPGTGKTTIGRALAHRLRSKFFLIDGTVIAGTGTFYEQITRIFDAAAQNPPAIIFIDDSDVVFESGTEVGLYRYLLTKLDGLESKSPGQVSLIMTAMDVGNMPPALVRSGRIELWLETRLPDETARLAILHDLRVGLPPAFDDFDPHTLAQATEGLSGADLRRVVDDGKLLFAYDRAAARSLRPLMDYFSDAVASVRSNKEKYAEAEARARAMRPERPHYFDGGGGAFYVQTMAMEELSSG